MEIDPVGGDYCPFVYTARRVVDEGNAVVQLEQGISSPFAAGTAEAAVATAELVAVEPVAEALAEIMIPAAPSSVAPVTSSIVAIADSTPELVVEPGDTVIVRYDDNRIRRFRLGAGAHRPEDGVVHIKQPIGVALLGNGLEEEIEFIVDGNPRTVVIEKISKATEFEFAD